MRQPSLATLFINYLANRRDDDATEQLAEALDVSGYALEAAGLRNVASGEVDVPDSAWRGRRMWRGAQLPRDGQAGDLWLDTCELTPMLLVPREEVTSGQHIDPALLEKWTPFIGWIATRPVHRWQYATFLRLAQLAPRQVQLEPPLRLLDPERVLSGPESAPITNLTADEARLCANWFGKAVANLPAWQAANAYLAPDELAALWATPSREWAGRLDDEYRVIVTPQTIDVDPRDELDLDEPPPPSERMLFGEWAIPDAVTFRTYVPTQVGLLSAIGDDGLPLLNVRLNSLAER